MASSAIVSHLTIEWCHNQRSYHTRQLNDVIISDRITQENWMMSLPAIVSHLDTKCTQHMPDEHCATTPSGMSDHPSLDIPGSNFMWTFRCVHQKGWQGAHAREVPRRLEGRSPSMQKVAVQDADTMWLIHVAFEEDCQWEQCTCTVHSTFLFTNFAWFKKKPVSHSISC